MHVHTHHVAQSVGQEHGVGTCTDGLVGVALHESQFLEALRHHAADGKVDVHILHAWLSDL